MNKGRILKDHQWDVFISHASEDKEEIVIPLAELLMKKGLRVWLDKHELLLGDSLNRKIDEGLRESRFGVVVLSKSFFAKEWPRKELDAMVSRENGKNKVILPIWHEVSKAYISQHSLLLSDKRAVLSTDGVDAVAFEILKVINKDLDERERLFTEPEIGKLLTAIEYQQARKGAFKDLDPIVPIRVKLKNRQGGLKRNTLNRTELSVLLDVVNENINYLNNYGYVGFTEEEGDQMRQKIKNPLSELRDKLIRNIYK